MSAYYNENDPKAAEWLRNLISENLIAPGVVDERSIVDVQPEDLWGFVQCHFFAGIGGWSYALRLAGWPDERPVWTGSCPCQPFSNAGKQKGADDARHLWPEFERLISNGRPSVVFGEQVASKAGRAWLSGVRADLETLGYGVGAADLCAAGVGAPHIRQRLWWVGSKGVDNPAGSRCHTERQESESEAWNKARLRRSERGCDGSGGRSSRMADTAAERRERSPSAGWEARSGAEHRSGMAYADRERHNGKHSLLRTEAEGRGGKSALSEAAGRSAGGGMGDADNARSQGWGVLPERTGQRSPWAASLDSWIPCGDGKARRLEPGIEPLAHGVPARLALLRGYGNAIVPQVAEIFIRAYADTLTPGRDV